MKVHKKMFCKTTKKHHCLKQRILPILFIFSLLCSAAAFPQETAAVTAGVIAGDDYYIMNAVSGNVILRSSTSGQPMQLGAWGLSTVSQRTWHVTHKSGTTQMYYFKTPEAYLSSGQSAQYFGFLSGDVISCTANMSSVTRYWWVERSASSEYQGCYLLTTSFNGVNYYLCESASHTLAVTSTRTDSCYWTFVAVSGSANICSVFYYDLNAENPYFNMTHHNGFFETTLNSIGRTAQQYENMSAATVGTCLKTGSVFVFAGHGKPGIVACQNSEAVTLGFVATSANSVAALSNVDDPSDYSNFYIRSQSANAFGREQCVLYLACYTGCTIDGENLVTDTYNKGAHYVFGYNRKIEPGALSMNLLEAFIYALTGFVNAGTNTWVFDEAHDINECIELALDFSGILEGYCYIAGDGRQYIGQ